MANEACVKAVMNATGFNEEEAQQVVKEVATATELEMSDIEITKAKSFETYNATREQILENKKKLTRIRLRNDAINKAYTTKVTMDAKNFYEGVQARSGKMLTPRMVEEGIISQIAGTNNDGDILGSSYSASSIMKAQEAVYLTALKRDLDKLNPQIRTLLGELNSVKQVGKALFYGEAGDVEFKYNVEKAMRGEPVDDELAKQTGEILGVHMWNWGSDVNKAGGAIPLKKRRAPQTWDVDGMIKKGKKSWVDFILENDIADNFTFDKRPIGERATNISEKNKRQALEKIYDSIVYGREPDGEGVDPAFWGVTRASAKFERKRMFEFKSTDKKRLYDEEFGATDLLTALAAEAADRAHAVGMMKKFGSDPEKTIANAIENVKDLIQKSDMPDTQKTAIMNKLDSNPKLRQSKIWKMFSVVSGEADDVVDVVSAKRWKLVRDIQTLSKLGGAAISALADMPNFVNGIRKFRGDFTGHFDYIQAVTAGYSEGQRREILEQAGDICDGIITHTMNRFDSTDVATGKMGLLADLMFRFTGLTGITNRPKAGFSYALQKELGRIANKDTKYNDLFAGMRDSLNEYGIDEARFDVLKKGKTTVEGDDFITPMEVRDISRDEFEQFIDQKYHAKNKPTEDVAEWERVRNSLLESERSELEFRLRSLIQGETRQAIMEPDARTKLVMTQGQKRGTPLGEAVRTLMQFKGFSVAFTQSRFTGKRGMQRMLGIVPNASAASNAFGVFHTVAFVTTMGYLSMSLKDLVAGKKPKDISRPSTIAAALLQSGGLGIYGDALFNAESRYGVFGLAAGPTGATVQETLGLLSKATKQIANDELDLNNLALQSFRLAKANTPLLNMNMWMFRAAGNLILWDAIENYFDPTALYKREQRLRNAYGQEYFLAPTKYSNNF